MVNCSQLGRKYLKRPAKTTGSAIGRKSIFKRLETRNCGTGEAGFEAIGFRKMFFETPFRPVFGDSEGAGVAFLLSKPQTVLPWDPPGLIP